MKTTFTTILATTATMALCGQAINSSFESENNPFYRLMNNNFSQNTRTRNDFAEADSCIESSSTVNLYQGDGEHIAIKSDRWEGPKLAQVEVDVPTCGSTLDRQAATPPNVDSLIKAGSAWTDSSYGRSVAMDGLDKQDWGWARA